MSFLSKNKFYFMGTFTYFLQLQMVLQSIIWPQVKQTDDSEDSDDLESETMKVAGFFRQFVEEGKISACKFGLCFSRFFSN